MTRRILAELAILVIFLAVALVTILWRGAATDVKGAGNAAEYVRLGDELYAAGKPKFNEAAVKYWEAIGQNPDMAEVHFKLASIYYENEWNYESLRELSELERIDPEHPGLNLLLGKIHHRMGDTEKAFEALQKAVNVQPENSEAHYYLGTIYQQRSMTEQAISEYQKAVTAGAKTATREKDAILKAHLQLGRVYKEKEQEKAEREFKEALSVDPEAVEVMSELRNLYRKQAEYYESQNEYDKAAEKYEEMVKIDPDYLGNIEIYMKVGDRYYQSGLYDKAAVMYEEAARLDPMNFSIYMALKDIEALRSFENGD